MTKINNNKYKPKDIVKNNCNAQGKYVYATNYILSRIQYIA